MRRDRKLKTDFTASDGKFGIPKGLSNAVRNKARSLAHYLQDRGAPLDLVRPIFDRYCKHLQFAHDVSLVMKKGSVDGKGRKKPEAQVWRDESAAASKIEGQLMNILKGTKAPKEKESELDKFKKAGKKLGVAKWS